MEKKNLLTLVITLTVGIILAGSLLVPVITDATTTHKTFENIGFYYMESPIPDDTTIAYEFSDSEWTINGETLPNLGIPSANLIVTDELIVRTAGATGQIRGSTSQTFISGTFTVTSEGITYSYVATNNQELTGTWTYSYVYCAVFDKADYIMTSNTATTNYMLADSPILGFGVTKVDSYDVFHITGDMDAVEVTCENPDVVISNVQINKTAISGYKNLYDFDSITFTATDGETSIDAVYNVVIIPSEITAELTNHLDGGSVAILSALPVIVIVGLVLAAVGAIFIRNRD